jgi:hypothetical protein
MDRPLLAGERTGLEYQYAFDACAMIGQGASKRTLLIATSQWHSAEILRRLYHRHVELCSSNQVQQLAAHTHGQFGQIIWAEPERSNIDGVLGAAQTLLAPGGNLLIIVGGRFARWLPERRSTIGALLADGQHLINRLPAHGWRAVQARGYHTPVSVAFTYCGQLLERAGRPELADRLALAARQTYSAQGQHALLTALCLVQVYRQD